MSTAELKELVANLLLSQQETALQMKNTDRLIQETALQMKDTDRKMKETDRQMKETDRQMKDTDRRLKELGIQIGGLGNKFGSFTEGLSYRSLAKILLEKFGMNDFIAPSVHVRKNGMEEEYDILAYSNGGLHQGMIVEIKSKLRDEDIAQMKRKMDRIFQFLPELRNKTFQGMIACVSGSAELKKQVLDHGWHLAHIGDDLFELETPENFVARTYAAV
jgi:hypothetical protein